MQHPVAAPGGSSLLTAPLFSRIRLFKIFLIFLLTFSRWAVVQLAGRRILAPLIKVRVLAAQPSQLHSASPSSSRPRTTAFHAVDRGSNPLGDANKKSRHLYYSRCFFSCLCRGTRIRCCGNLSRRGVPAKAATPLFASTHYIFCLYIRQPASTENSIHENGLSAISGIHIPAYSPLPGICSARIYSSIPHNFRTSFCGRLVSRVTSL